MRTRMHFVVAGCLALVLARPAICLADSTPATPPSPNQQQTDALNLQKLQLDVESSRIANEKARVDALKDAVNVPLQSIGKVTAATTNLDSFTSYAIADELVTIGKNVSDQICSKGDGVVLLTNNDELPKLLFVADQVTQTISRLTKYAGNEIVTLDKDRAKQASKPEKSGPGHLSVLGPLAAVSIGLSAAEGIASTLRPDYQISAATQSTDYLTLYSGIIRGPQDAKPSCTFIIPHVHSPALASPLNEGLNTLDSQKHELDLAIARAQQVKNPSADLAAEITVAVALSKDISTFDSSLFAAPTAGGPSLFQQASDALWLNTLLDADQTKAKIVVLHLAVAGGSTMIRGATLWKNPKASYVYAVRVTGLVLDKDGTVKAALGDNCVAVNTDSDGKSKTKDCGAGSGTVPLKW